MVTKGNYESIEVGEKTRNVEFPYSLLQPEIFDKYSPLFSNKLVNITNLEYKPAKNSSYINLDNQLKERLINELFQECNSKNIKIALLKGNALNFLLGEIKQTADIDILVLCKPTELEKILRKKYRRIYRKNSKYTEKQQVTWQHLKYKDQYLDLHNELGNPIFYKIPTTLVNDNIVEFSYNKTTIYFLSPELMIANYLIQIVMDGNLRHYGLIDIRLIINFFEINHKKLLDILKKLDLIKISRLLDITTNNSNNEIITKEKFRMSILKILFNKQPGRFLLTNKIKKVLLYIMTSEKPFSRTYKLISNTLE